MTYTPYVVCICHTYIRMHTSYLVRTTKYSEYFSTSTSTQYDLNSCDMHIWNLDIANGEQNSTVIVRDTTTGSRSGMPIRYSLVLSGTVTRMLESKYI